MSTLNAFQQWQVANGHHVTEEIDGDEFHAPELCPRCQDDGAFDVGDTVSVSLRGGSHFSGTVVEVEAHGRALPTYIVRVWRSNTPRLLEGALVVANPNGGAATITPAHRPFVTIDDE